MTADNPEREPAPVGRPSTYSPELASRICDRLVEGISVREVCEGVDMPAPSTVFLWLQKHKEFSEQYARALEARTEAMADDILEIADNGTNDFKVRTLADGTADLVVDSDHIQRSRLRIDARKWLMSKMAPKKYGDKIENTIQGPEGGPVQVVSKIERTIVRPDPGNPNG
jgi:transposase-like protein